LSRQKPKVRLVPSPGGVAKSMGARRQRDVCCGRVAALLASLLVAVAEASTSLADPCPEHLFIIERSKNANVVVYDANRGPAGDFAASKPVVAYWLLNGERGKREELNAVEWQRAYGFDIMPGDTPATFVMAFKADRKRHLTIRTLNDCPVVTGPIDGHDGVLHRMFVRSNESSIPPKVEYVEFFGQEVATSKPLYEKSIPAK
jgi:uncharacterized protein DUF4833